MKLNIDIGLTIRPERNPELGLPAMVSTRRGITVCGPMKQHLAAHEEMAEWDLKAAMRGLSHWVERWQAGEVEGPPDATDPKLVLMTDELFRVLGGRVQWHEPIGEAVTFGGERVPVFAPSVVVDVS